MLACTRVHEIVRPNMIAIFRAQPDARSIVQPEPSLLRLFHWYFEPLTSPQTLNTFVIHLPTRVSQQGCNPTVTISAVLARQLDHICDQAFFVSTTFGQPPLRGSVLAQYPANTTLRNLHLNTHMIDASTAARGAQKFPEAASLKISLSSVRSEFPVTCTLSKFWSVPRKLAV